MRDGMLWLDPIPEPLRDAAVDALNAGDTEGFLVTAGNTWSMHLVMWNQRELKRRGLYEKALAAAFTASRVNNHHVPVRDLRDMFAVADRSRLRACGDPLPGPGPFTVYRGVAGSGAARRVRGYSWTADRDKARWFAERFAATFHDPAVFESVVPVDHVLYYTNELQEQEFVLDLPANLPVRRVWRASDERS